MLRYKPLPNAIPGAGAAKLDGSRVGSGVLSLDAGQNPVMVLRTADRKLGAVICVTETGAGYANKIKETFAQVLRRFAAGGGKHSVIEAAITGGADGSEWKIQKLRKAAMAESVTPQEFDLNGLYYRKIYFDPKSGDVSVYKERANPASWNPATANLSLTDGTRAFSEGHAGGVVANATRFFRETSTFKALRELIIPEHLAVNSGKPFNVWCAACSNGIEAYSYAMYIHRLLYRANANIPFTVFGTDINAQLIENAIAGEYEINDKDLKSYKAYLNHYGTVTTNRITMKPEIRRHLSFRVFDIRNRPRKRRFSMIICANVFQYYNDDARAFFLENFISASERPGYIFVGPVRKQIIKHLSLTQLINYRMLRVD